jgi:hypothetical protein
MQANRQRVRKGIPNARCAQLCLNITNGIPDNANGGTVFPMIASILDTINKPDCESLSGIVHRANTPSA